MASRADPAPPAAPPVLIPQRRPEPGGLAALLQYEAEMRRQASEMELVYFLANETRRLLDYGQMFVLRLPRIGESMHVIAASSLAAVDRNAPLIQAVERVVRTATADCGTEAVRITPQAHDRDASLDDYPFPEWQWQPLSDADGKAFAGLLVARAAPLDPGEITRVERIAETASHAWRALKGPRPVRRISRLDKRQRRALIIAGALFAVFPVRLSTLAPVEVVADRPYTLSAPFAGLIQRLEVAPNTPVRKGQPLVRFDDVRPRNELTLATERLAVARARAERASSAAFGSAEASREIAIEQAERDLAQAEHDYARDVLAQSVLRAPRDGVAIYSDRRDFEGRALNVGDPIVQIADPARVRFRVDLPAREQISLSPGAPVKVWLDGQPLWAIDARLETASYAARPTAEGVLAFALVARPIAATPHIGARGTARVEGRWVPLIYALLRRPITAARQTIGI